MKKCKYCKSILVCWNWFKFKRGWGHECWDCGCIQETKEKVNDGISYQNLNKHI